MAIIKCKMCGGDIELSADKTYGTCDSCGSTMTFPKVDDEHRANLFNRANHFRRQNEFDKAVSAYERILDGDNTDAEAHWGVVLSRFGIEYVEDPVSHERIPTCHRVQSASILTDEDYLAALEYAPDGYSRDLYEAEAKRIADIQKGILAISAQEKPYDVFICYKETTDGGTRTKDSTLAQDIYYQLKQEGFNVFFARITLEDKLGQQYEPYIFAALNSAKVMLVVGTKPEYFNAVWLKNEWSRYLALMKLDRSKLLIPCFRDMDAYDLPDELSALQSQDMSKIGFMQDLIRGVKKVLSTAKPQQAASAAASAAPVSAIAPLLRRAFMFLEDGDWVRADEFCENVLNMEPENAEAYLGKLMAEHQVKKREALKDCEYPFDQDSNYQKVLRFGDEKLKAELQGYIQHINTRNENARLEGLYREAYGRMKNARTHKDFLRVFCQFKSIEGYKDAAALAAECAQIAEQRQKDENYDLAINTFKGGQLADFHNAQRLFRSTPGWKDADQMAEICVQRIAEWEEREAARKLERQRLEEEHLRKEAEKERLQNKILLIAFAVAAVVIAILCMINYVIIPNNKYNAALELKDAEKYEEAITAFAAIKTHKDSTTQIKECETAILDREYDAAVALKNAGQYSEAYDAFIGLNGHKDSQTKANSIYDKAMAEKWSKAKVGDYITFGSYEQDDNTSNGKEAIEWLVLAKENNRLLAISRYALDSKRYNESRTNVTWETCTLRKWLNNDFLKAAFSSAEQAMIPTMTVAAHKNPNYSTEPGNDTQDKIFLLSITEAEKYFSSDSAMKCKPTAYAKKQGADTSSNSYCFWWLRSPGHDQDNAANVSSGGVNEYGNYVNYDNFTVRPALWINLNP